MRKLLLRLKLNYLIWKCDKSHKKLLKLEKQLEKLRGNEDENDD